MNKILIVSLNLYPEDASYKHFGKLSAVDKIKLIASRIDALCHVLTKEQPDSNWVFVWREYGIRSPKNKFISVQDKNELKVIMQQLTLKYPQLTIISGTVAVRKHFDTNTYQQRLVDINTKYYSNHPNLSEEEVKMHYDVFKYYMNGRKKKKGIDIIRNTAYVFAKGECIARHDKIMPYFELHDNEGKYINGLVFQPGNKKTPRGVVPVTLQNNESIGIGIEICREHNFGVLQQELNAKALDCPPLIHFIIAEGMDYYADFISGEYAVLLDDDHSPQLILKRPTNPTEYAKLPIALYEHNLLQADISMRGPLMPLYPYELNFLSRFDELSSVFENNTSNSVPLLDALLNIKKFYYQNTSLYPSAELAAKITKSKEYRTLLQCPKDMDEETHKTAVNMLNNLIDEINEYQSVLHVKWNEVVPVIPTSNPVLNLSSHSIFPARVEVDSANDKSAVETLPASSIQQKK